MQIIHRRCWRPTDAQIADLVALGFEPDVADGFLVMDVDEADPLYCEPGVSPPNASCGRSVLYSSRNASNCVCCAAQLRRTRVVLR